MINKDYKDIILGYLAFWNNLDETQYVCGVLSVDLYGYPIECRITNKIEIDENQKIYYGDSLKSYLIRKVIGTKIIEILDTPPDLILVNEHECLYFREFIDTPVISITETTNGEIDANGKEEDIKTFNSIPKQVIELDVYEPFNRLIKSIENSFNTLNNEDDSE